MGCKLSKTTRKVHNMGFDLIDSDGDHKVSNDELKDLGLDNDIVIPSVKDDEDFYTGQSDFEGYLSLDTDTSFSPGFERMSNKLELSS